MKDFIVTRHGGARSVASRFSAVSKLRIGPGINFFIWKLVKQFVDFFKGSWIQIAG